MGIFGDSYCGYNIFQQAVATYHGMTLEFQDCRAGRPIGGSTTNGIFECYGGSATGKNVGAALSPDGGGWGTCAAANNGTVGNTVAQDIAKVDLILVELGTNDVYNETLGTMADTPTTNSTYGFIKAALNGLSAAKPQMRIVWVEPWQLGDPIITNTATGQSRSAQMPAIALAIEQVCATYGVPVVKLLSESGLNSYNWSIFLQSDLVHPSTVGWNQAYIPAVELRLATISPLD
jgi:lysophospholipase L1-like esterase